MMIDHETQEHPDKQEELFLLHQKRITQDEVDFSTADVVLIARALVAEWRLFGGYNACILSCRYCDCDALFHDPDGELEHENTCPVMVAQDVLTRME